jgi:hypothetical protein
LADKSPIFASARRFIKEAQTIARWRHEKIIRIYCADDQDGFYIYNASSDNHSISPIALECPSKSGKPLNHFDGWRWADFYPTMHSNRCMRIEIQNNPIKTLSA